MHDGDSGRSDVTPPARRSEALARLHAAGAFGYAVGQVGGRLADRGQHLLLSGLCTASFIVLAPAVALLLPETRPAAAPAADERRRRKRRRRRRRTAAAAAGRGRGVARPAGAAAAARDGAARGGAAVQVGVSIPLLARSVGWSATQMGVFVGRRAGRPRRPGPLPWALRSPRVSDAGALLAGNACLTLAALAARATALRLWLCLPLHIGAVALPRTLSASVVSKAAPAEMRGEALGALDAVSSLCRIGADARRLPRRPPRHRRALPRASAAGATTLWRVVPGRRVAPPDRDR